MRILFIARYRDVTMTSKIGHLARLPDLAIDAILPASWHDELLHRDQNAVEGEGFRIHTLGMFGSPADPHRALYRSLSFGINAVRPDIIHTEEEPDSLTALQIALARRLFAPKAKLLLHTWQNLARPLSAPVRWVLDRTLAAADAVFCANQEAVTLLRRYGYSRSTPIIPSIGVDTDVFRPRLASPGPPFTVGYVGRLVPEKGIDLLIDAIGTLRDRGTPVHLRIIGGGPAKRDLRAQVDRLHLQSYISFTAAVPPAQIAAEMATLHALVLPSRQTPVWKEQLGRVLLEAMAVGVPVIGAQSGAIPEVIGDAGLLFPEGDAGALAACIHRLRQEQDLSDTLTKLGIRRAQEHYSQRILAARTADFYRQILS